MQRNFFSPRYLLIILFAVVTLSAFLLYKQKSPQEQNNVPEPIVNQETISAVPEAKTGPAAVQEPITKETFEPIPVEAKEPVTPNTPLLSAAPTSEKPEHLNFNDYCKGFTSLTAEFKLKKLEIEGIVPSWLYGSFVSVGPAKFEIGEHKAQHWLEGFAMIHRFSLLNHKGLRQTEFR